MRDRKYITLILAASLFSLTGCATRGDIENLRMEITELKQIVEQSNANSLDATKLARASLQRLDEVEKTALTASSVAADADKKINVVFEKAMRK